MKYLKCEFDPHWMPHTSGFVPKLSLVNNTKWINTCFKDPLKKKKKKKKKKKFL